MLKSFMFSEEVDTSKLKAVPVATSRYDSKVILSTAQGDYTRLLKLSEIKTRLTDTDGYMNIDLLHQYDPYRVAYDVYGSESLYWVILAANDLFSMFDLVEGMTIRLPNILKILGYNGLVVSGDEL